MWCRPSLLGRLLQRFPEFAFGLGLADKRVCQPVPHFAREYACTVLNLQLMEIVQLPGVYDRDVWCAMLRQNFLDAFRTSPKREALILYGCRLEGGSGCSNLIRDLFEPRQHPPKSGAYARSSR